MDLAAALLITFVGMFTLGWFVHQLTRALGTNNELLAIDRHRPDTSEELARVSRATAHNYELIQDLTLAVAEGVRSVARAEKRVAKTVQVARRQLAASGLEHPGLEAEAEELRERDAEGSDEGELPAVQEDVEEDFTEVETYGIPGFDPRQLS